MVLAAGRSSRMGAVKALLPMDEGRTALARILAVHAGAGFAPTLVVVGFHKDAVAAEATRRGARPVENPAPEGGQISSLRAGLRALDPGVPGVLVHPVDHPGVREETVVRLAAEIRDDPGRIVVTSLGGRRGHPTWFPAATFAELLDPALEGGARGVLRRDPLRVHHVVVDDPGVRIDLDTPADLAGLAAPRDGGGA